MHGLTALTYSWVEVPLAVSILGADPARRIREPVPGLVLSTARGLFLLDTGYGPWTTPPDTLRTALAGVGLGVPDVAGVVLSHLHADHAGGLAAFAGTGCPIYVQRRELDWARGADPEVLARAEVLHPDSLGELAWVALDGEVRVAPGVRVVPTPGHTPGHQSLVVDAGGPLPRPGYIFCADAADLTENIEEDLPVGTAIGVPPESTLVAIRALRALGAALGYTLVPGHDPFAWPALAVSLRASGVPGAPRPAPGNST